MLTEREMELIETLRENEVFCRLLGDFGERMMKHTDWHPTESITDLMGRLNDITAELGEFLRLFAPSERLTPRP